MWWFYSLRSLRSLNHSVRPPSQNFGEDAPASILTLKLIFPYSPPLQCKLGHLIPTNPHCGVLGHGAASDWRGNLEVSASSHVVFNGDLDLDSAQLDLEPEEERLSNTLIINDNATPR